MYREYRDKSAGDVSQNKGNFGTGNFKFSPKKTIKSFRDLEVYQKSLECADIIYCDIVPRIEKMQYKYAEKLLDTSTAVPLLIAEAHSLRFADFALALGYLEKAMSSCNKTIVYLDQIKGVYGQKVNPDMVDEIANRYINIRLKMYRLEKGWHKYMDKVNESAGINAK